MKGLEFQAVFVPHLNNAFERKSPPVDEGFIAETRQRIYTAMTRARHTLVMTYHERVPKELLKPIEEYVWHEKP
jgi:superfamily I DNA/RNA helicase